MNAHRLLVIALAVLGALYAMLLFVSSLAAPLGLVLTTVSLILVSTRYAWRPKFLAFFDRE
ncbi:hypothetical protein JS530_06180 [Bifidobacterium sp. LC6]|uniref:Uncharacterized protein n=1 Tax=Bifidobacterium colobi TaxID=2809026 RepID=A0ABS5UVP8_9BIFI|nr:hypothetical protein [Bifidobacterium colobi]MBT1175090.1 hypothetical protein [Bifidobacterium colobi]